MNASSPAFEFSFARSGMTGTGTFCAFPLASAGLYTAGAVCGVALPGRAIGDEALEVGVAVVVPVGEAGLPGVLLPWQPHRSTAKARAATACRTRTEGKDINVWRGMVRLPSSCFGDLCVSLGGSNIGNPAGNSRLWITFLWSPQRSPAHSCVAGMAGARSGSVLECRLRRESQREPKRIHGSRNCRKWRAKCPEN